MAVNDAPNVGNDQQQNAATPVSGLANDNNPKPSPSSDGNTKAAEQPQYHLIGGRDAQEIMDPAACLFIAK